MRPDAVQCAISDLHSPCRHDSGVRMLWFVKLATTSSRSISSFMTASCPASAAHNSGIRYVFDVEETVRREKGGDGLVCSVTR